MEGLKTEPGILSASQGRDMAGHGQPYSGNMVNNFSNTTNTQRDRAFPANLNSSITSPMHQAPSNRHWQQQQQPQHQQQTQERQPPFQTQYQTQQHAEEATAPTTLGLSGTDPMKMGESHNPPRQHFSDRGFAANDPSQIGRTLIRDQGYGSSSYTSQIEPALSATSREGPPLAHPQRQNSPYGATSLSQPVQRNQPYGSWIEHGTNVTQQQGQPPPQSAQPRRGANYFSNITQKRPVMHSAASHTHAHVRALKYAKVQRKPKVEDNFGGDASSFSVPLGKLRGGQGNDSFGFPKATQKKLDAEKRSGSKKGDGHSQIKSENKAKPMNLMMSWPKELNDSAQKQKLLEECRHQSLHKSLADCHYQFLLCNAKAHAFQIQWPVVIDKFQSQQKPKGGEVYIFRKSSEGTKFRDGWSWKKPKGGTRKNESDILHCIQYECVQNPGLVRKNYFYPHDKRVCLLHYLNRGSEAEMGVKVKAPLEDDSSFTVLAKQAAHGAAKDDPFLQEEIVKTLEKMSETDSRARVMDMDLDFKQMITDIASNSDHSSVRQSAHLLLGNLTKSRDHKIPLSLGRSTQSGGGTSSHGSKVSVGVAGAGHRGMGAAPNSSPSFSPSVPSSNYHISANPLNISSGILRLTRGLFLLFIT
jgi:hypothetical protein